MVLPDRLEGAVLGQLLATAGGVPGDSDDLLGQLERLLTGLAAPEPRSAPSAGRSLAAALVPRDVPARDLAATAASIAAGGGRDGSAVAGRDRSIAASGVMYALTTRCFLDGERNRNAALRQARRQAAGLRHETVGPVLGAGQADTFDAAWNAFAAARVPGDARSRAADLAAAGPPGTLAAPLVGGLAGIYWGSEGIPRRLGRQVASPERARRIVDRLIETQNPSHDGLGWQTSTSAPLVVHDVSVVGTSPAITGSVGITPLPGRRYVAYHTGAHWRDLDADARRLRELGIDLLFLLVEDRELARCRVTDIAAVLRAHDIDLVRYPIRDPLVPHDRHGFRVVVDRVLGGARDGRRIAVACRGGFDRAGMTAACLLRAGGLDAATAIDRVQRARPGALTLPDQQAYVRGWTPG
jgi:Cyclin-dependent kinase inhibitor 3 (CDKN3)